MSKRADMIERLKGRAPVLEEDEEELPEPTDEELEYVPPVSTTSTKKKKRDPYV